MSMKNIEELREEIRKTDRQMADLFQKRMASVREVAAYKKERGLQVKDAGQEKRVLERNGSLIAEDELRPYYLMFMQGVMDVSCRYQEDLMKQEGF